MTDGPLPNCPPEKVVQLGAGARDDRAARIRGGGKSRRSSPAFAVGGEAGQERGQ